MNKLSFTRNTLTGLAAGAIFTFAVPTAEASMREFSPPIYSKKWNANWARSPMPDAQSNCVLHFRRSFELKDVPEKFAINVSADNRFVLYVNGTLAARGPARGDAYNWHYHEIDIAKYLHPGKNTIAAKVWDMSNSAPVAQITRGLAFVLDGATKDEDFVATPKNWKVKKCEAYSKSSMAAVGFTGNCDTIDAAKEEFGWNLPEFDDSRWPNAANAGEALTSASGYGEFNRMLTPSPIPQMEEKSVRLKTVRRAEGISAVTDFIGGKEPLVVPPNTKCKILLDNGKLTNAYPVLTTEAGKGSIVKLRFAEALYDAQNRKGNRNEIEGKKFDPASPCDTFKPDGGAKRVFSTLWFRTYRYVELEIQTGAEPLKILDLYGIYTAYPFKENGFFKSSDKSLEKIWEVGWRTARLCANETYFDCPYYEQMQYVGDTRIQALISYYVSGDARLARHAINMFNASRSPEGITQSRYPSRKEQFIPPFSLYWVSMVNDYAMHTQDADFVKKMLPGIRGVISWYLDKLDTSTGMLRPRVPYWNFADWANGKGISGGWFRGTPPESEDSGSTINTLHLAYTLGHAASLMRLFGEETEADKYELAKKNIIAAARKHAWDESRGLFSDYRGSKSFSQHANIMAVLSDAVEPEKQTDIVKKILSDTSLTQCTFYYRFYLAEAMRKAGLADMYPSAMQPWNKMIENGLSTFAETPEPTRSDCHAWSSSPNYHLLSITAGIMPAEYGFKSVNIEPHLGCLENIDAAAAHPNGKIRVQLQRNGKGICGKVFLPEKLSGRFKWNSASLNLSEGENIIDIKQ